MKLWWCIAAGMAAAATTAAARVYAAPALHLALDFITHKAVTRAVYIHCRNDSGDSVNVVRAFNERHVVASAWRAGGGGDAGELAWRLQHERAPLAVLLVGCRTAGLLEEASQVMLFDDTHKWLVLLDEEEARGNASDAIHSRFHHLNLSVDADIAVASSSDGIHYELYDVFNFGKIQGNDLEIAEMGCWSAALGLDIYLKGYKYELRRDFHNLTFRAVTVLLQGYSSFPEEELASQRFSRGVPFLTKIAMMVLVMLKEHHNFQYNYTFIYRWIGTPEANSTPAVSNQLYWRHYDLAATGSRIFPTWLQWFDPCMPALHTFQTRIFYRIPDKGVGQYENRFLTPLSAGVWRAVVAAGVACAVAVAAAAARERRPRPAQYAVFSVAAAACQQAFEDGDSTPHNASSQGGRLTLLVVGLTSMLLYNYYTSSVVSWLLSAAAPTVDSLDALIQSDLELIFEDTGYGRQWVYNPGPLYLSGYKNVKEDELREKKIKRAKRSVDPIQTTEDGINLLRQGGYAFHADVYTASHYISRSFSARELCDLGALRMISGNLFIVTQKRSPYKQFFSWSLSRLSEAGLVSMARRRLGPGALAGCPGTAPRALALGHAAPALLLLAAAAALAVATLLAECLTHRYYKRRLQMQRL